MSPDSTALTRADAPRAVGSGHHQVLRRAGAVEAAHGRPVTDHDAVEAPLAVERRLEQVVLGHGGAVDGVVGAHHQPGLRLGDRLLEGQQVELAQRSFVDLDVDGEAVGLGVVGDVVLRGGADTVVLHAAHVRRGEVGGQDRVLAEALEVPAVERGAVQVDGGAEHDVDPLATGLDRGRRAVATGDVGVPGRRQSGRRGQVERGVPLVPRLATHARRTVGDQDAAQPDLLDGPGVPEVASGEELDLLLEVSWPVRRSAPS